MNNKYNLALKNICWLAVISAFVVSTYSWLYYAMFTKFHIYDDEGYLLLTVRQFVHGGGLYEKFQSLYGPFYYFYNWIVHKIMHFPVTHNITRLQTVFEWTAVCVLSSLLVRQVTGSIILSVLVFLQMIPATYNLTNEPGHPQGILIVSIVAFFVVWFSYLKNTQKRVPLLIASILCATVFMNKLHIGTFLFCSVVLTITCHGNVKPLLRICLKWLIPAALIVAPYMIMHRHLDTFWGSAYFCVVMGALVPVLIAVTMQSNSNSFTIRDMMSFMLVFLTGTFLLLVFINSQGTSWYGILRGLIVKPFLFPTMNVDPAVFWPKSKLLALFSMGAGSIFFLTARRLEKKPFFIWVMLFVKLCFVLAIYTALLERYYRLLNYIMPFIWLAFTPVTCIRNVKYLLFLSVFTPFAALNAMHGYPVCGSQFQWATFLLIPLAALCLADISTAVKMRISQIRKTLQNTIKVIVYGIIPLIFIGTYIDKLLVDPKYSREQYENLISLNLPGADKIHLPADETGRYQWLTSNLNAHSDMFVSMPGYMSYYFWTNTQPPDYFTSSGWTIVYDDTEQQRVIDSLKTAGRPCVIVNQEGIDFWANPGEQLRQGPLVRYIDESFVVALMHPPFEFRVLRDRPRTGITNYLWFGAISLSGTPQDCLSCPRNMLPLDTAFTLELQFKTTKAGVLLEVQNRSDLIPDDNQPLLYIGTDGLLYGRYPSDNGSITIHNFTVNDGQWHRVAYRCDGSRVSVYLDDSEPVHSGIQPITSDRFPILLIGNGYARNLPSAPDGWFPFSGELHDIILSQKHANKTVQ